MEYQNSKYLYLYTMQLQRLYSCFQDTGIPEIRLFSILCDASGSHESKMALNYIPGKLDYISACIQFQLSQRHIHVLKVQARIQWIQLFSILCTWCKLKKKIQDGRSQTLVFCSLLALHDIENSLTNSGVTSNSGSPCKILKMGPLLPNEIWKF